MHSKFRSHLLASSKAHAKRKSHRILMEALEPRELLTVTVAAGGKTATFTDIDGDLVTVAVTKGTLTAGLFTTALSGQGEQLQELDLSNAAFSGTNLTISVKQSGGGDGLTNVGYINAGSNAVGKTIVSGDLGRIDAGTNSSKSGITSLSVFSLGRQGTSSQEAGGTLVSNIGALGSLSVSTDVNQAFVNVAGNIGNVTVGGSVIGGTAVSSGSIQAGGGIGNVFIGQNLSGSSDVGAAGASYSGSVVALGGSIGNVSIVGSILGGSAYDSGDIYANNKIGKVVIGGSIVGGTGSDSGEIFATSIASATVNGSVVGGGGLYSGGFDAVSMGNITIGGSLVGGSGDDSGSILCDSMGNVTIDGSIIGGTGSDSGALFASNGSLGNLGKVVVMQDLVGGDYNGSGNATDSFYTGYIESTGKIASVFIGGNVTAGNNGTAATLESGTIRAGTTIGTIQINGSLIGSATQDAIIDAGGVSSAKGSVAIGSILIGGRIDHGQILAGFLTNQTGPIIGALIPINGGAQIGKITVDGDWIASSVMAGTAVGNDTLPGTGDDVKIGGVGTGLGKITSITIFGQVFGTAAGGDHFGFISSSIGSFSAAGVKATLTTGKDNILVGGTNDVTILEV